MNENPERCINRYKVEDTDISILTCIEQNIRNTIFITEPETLTSGILKIVISYTGTNLEVKVISLC